MQGTFTPIPDLTVCRTPLLPSSVAYTLWSMEGARPLEELLRDKQFISAAVRIASPTLYQAVDDWLSGRPFKNPKTVEKLLKYVVRMSTRTTPFGLFAGIAQVRCGEQTTLSLKPFDAIKTRSRLDMSYVMQAVRGLENDGQIRRRLIVYLNDLYIRSVSRVYVLNERRLQNGGADTRQYAPISFRRTLATDYIMDACANGVRYGDLIGSVAEKFRLDSSRAERLVDALWQAGMFVSELQPNPTVPFDALRERICRVSPEAAAELSAANDAVTATDGEAVPARTGTLYANLAPIQVDTYAPVNGMLARSVLDEAARLAEFTYRFRPAAGLRAYRERFVARYEGRERLVPLLELTDAEFGIGAPSRLEPIEEEPERDRFLFELAATAAREGRLEVDVETHTLDRILFPPARADQLPDAFEMGFQIAARSADAIDRGEYTIAPASLIGSDAPGKTLARFLDLFEDDRAARVLRQRFDEDDTLVEVVHLPPADRAGNVVRRPLLHARELAVGVPRTPKAERISPQDLFVGIENDRFFVYSKSLGRRLNPVETHSYASSRLGANVLRFLSLLPRDGRRPLSEFDWGKAEELPFLPRLRYGKFVFRRARWRLSAAALSAGSGDNFAFLCAWLERWNVPRFVTISELDNKMLIDTRHELGRNLIAEQLNSKRREALLEEFYPSFDEHWLERDGERYAAEFVAAFSSGGVRSAPSRVVSPVLSRPRFMPGGEWIYVKLYCGPGRIEALLRNDIRTWISRCRAIDAHLEWHFVRYGDVQPHLRLRVKTVPAHRSRIAAMLQEFLTQAAEQMLIDRFEYATYEPEIERYGIDTIQDVEAHFTACSDRALAALGNGVQTENERILAAVRSFRDAFGLCHFDVPPRSSKLDAATWALIKTAAADVPASVRSCRIAAMWRALFHMCCNRFGVFEQSERLAIDVLVESNRMSRKRMETRGT
jgi:hypothetical protein